MNPLVTVSGNASGSVIGKMLSPQSIAVATASAGLTGKEAALFRFTVVHSFIILMFICLMVLVQAYWLPAMVPQSHVAEVDKTAIIATQNGWIYLTGIVVVMTLFVFWVTGINRK